MLLGDWCMSIWNAPSRTLVLAKDPIGARNLFYSVGKEQIAWCTILDPLVLIARRMLTLCEEYVAGSYFFFPSARLTPFSEILQVPPASFVQLTTDAQEVHKYWKFDPKQQIRYRSDAEYEEHFRTVFARAVKRRLRSHTPVLAELSGGMDSSAIVCMADGLIAKESAEVPRLDTVSYYDDSEPNWNEKPYFSAVERRRGRIGCHIDVGHRESLLGRFGGEEFAATPFSQGGNREQSAKTLQACMQAQGNRVLLSGIGGDEVLGGSPDPLPELRNLLVTLRLRILAHQLKLWALEKRKPWLHLFLDSLRGFLPSRLGSLGKQKGPVPWLDPSFVRRNWAAIAGYPSAIKPWGPMPAFQDNLAVIHSLERQLASTPLPCHPACEIRYPFLDRELLEFLCAIPREQVVRPGERRALMRRSLVGIVPTEILGRKRKAFVARAPMVALAAAWPELVEMAAHLVSGALGIVNPKMLKEALCAAHQGRETLTIPMTRTVAMELWLRTMRSSNILLPEPHLAAPAAPRSPKHRARNALWMSQALGSGEQTSGGAS
jgi:asparagine synthase (glutamine-hydrolysing)